MNTNDINSAARILAHIYHKPIGDVLADITLLWREIQKTYNPAKGKLSQWIVFKIKHWYIDQWRITRKLYYMPLAGLEGVAPLQPDMTNEIIEELTNQELIKLLADNYPAAYNFLREYYTLGKHELARKLGKSHKTIQSKKLEYLKKLKPILERWVGNE